MAVRTSYVGTQVAGDVLTAANFTKLPGGWIGYAEITTSQTGITAEADITGLTVTVTVGSNRRIRITGNARITAVTTAGHCIGFIKEGGTALSRWFTEDVPAASSTKQSNSVVLTPSTGAHTYKLTAQKFNGGNTLTVEAFTTEPAFILVEDLGPAA